jgi:hypothetical protein
MSLGKAFAEMTASYLHTNATEPNNDVVVDVDADSGEIERVQFVHPIGEGLARQAGNSVSFGAI